MLRLAFFIDSVGFGGAERSLTSLLGCLDYDKVQVDLYAWNFNGAFADFIPEKVNRIVIEAPRSGVKKLAFRLGQLKYSLLIRLYPLLGVKRHQAELLWRSIGTLMPVVQEKYDVAVSYQQGFMTYFVAEKVKAVKKMAWVNSQLSGHNHRVNFSRKFYDKYDNVVCVSDQLLDILPRDGYVDARKLSVIHDILNPQYIRGMAEKECVLSDEKRLKIVTVARLSEPKNIPLAIKTARILKDKGLDFVWHVVGAGPLEQDLRNMVVKEGVKDCFVLDGFKKNPYPYIKEADIYVQTSSYEGFGLTIAEAKILKRPIVSTNFPVVVDQINDGVNGLVSEQSPECLAMRIMELANDKDLCQKLQNAMAAEINTTSHTEVKKFYNLIGL